MKYLKIQNNGILDIRLVALMGGTTKANDIFKIGQFGTGLKYTLAFLFRQNLGFKIFLGEQEVKVHIEVEKIREEDFEIICINGHRTSITTRMGVDWKPWMILRELWCNALDEGGAVKDICYEPVGTPDTTTFYIQIDRDIQEVLDQWNKYFIHEQEPIFANENYAIYPAGEHLCIYKQGVLIHEATDEKSIFSYDLKSATLNELRQFQGSASMAVALCLQAANEKAASYFLENVTEEHFEGDNKMDYNWWGSFSDSWQKVIGNAKLIYQKVLDDIKARGNTPDESALIVVPKVVYKALTKQFEGIGALRLADQVGEFYENYDEKLEKRIKQGLTILESCEYFIHPELEFIYGIFEDKTVQAKIKIDEKKIYISQNLLQRPLFDIVTTLVEENEHYNTGLSDKTREFQQHFIDLFTKELLAKNAVEI